MMIQKFQITIGREYSRSLERRWKKSNEPEKRLSNNESLTRSRCSNYPCSSKAVAYMKPETYLLQEENGNLFMNTGFRIDVSAPKNCTGRR